MATPVMSFGRQGRALGNEAARSATFAKHTASTPRWALWGTRNGWGGSWECDRDRAPQESGRPVVMPSSSKTRRDDN